MPHEVWYLGRGGYVHACHSGIDHCCSVCPYFMSLVEMVCFRQ
jgi:hypothetical protein